MMITPESIASPRNAAVGGSAMTRPRRTRSSASAMGGTAATPAAAGDPTATAGAIAAPTTAAADPNAPIPPAPAAGSAPVTPTGGTFDATNNAIGSVIAPTTSARLAGTQATTDNALSALSAVPDRYKLAQDKFGTYANATDPAFQKSITDTTKAAAANGTVGSGMLNSSYGNLALSRTKDLTNERDSLFQDAQSQQMSDLLNTLGASRATEGQVASQDAATRGEQRTERDYQANRGDTALAQLLQQTQVQDQLANSGSTRAINEATANDNLTNSAYGRATGEATTDEALTQGAFNRALQQAQVGYQNDPTLAQLTASGQAGQTASQDFSDVGSLLKLLAQNKNGIDLSKILPTAA